MDGCAPACRGPELHERIVDLCLSGLRNGAAALTLVAMAGMPWSSRAAAQPVVPRAFGGDITDFELAGGKLFVAGSFLGVSASEDVTGDVAVVDGVTGRRPLVSAVPRRRGGGQITSDGEGGHYVAGNGHETGLSRHRVDGSEVIGPFLNGGYATVTLRVGATLYVGGTWRDLWPRNGQPRVDQPFLAALDADTLQPLPWRPVVNGAVETLFAMNGVLYVGGAFTSVANAPGQPTVGRNKAAAFDIASGAVTTWNPSPNGDVRVLTGAGTTLYFSGSFSQVAGQPRSSVAAVDAASGALLPWSPSPGSAVVDLVVTGDTVVLAGLLYVVGGQPRRGVAAVDAVTGAVLPWAPQPNDSVSALAAHGGVVYACGWFTRVAGQVRSGCASFDFSVGGALQPWNPSLNGPVRDVVAVGGQVGLTGFFTGINATVRKGLAALDPTTGRLLDWEAPPDLGTVSIGGIESSGSRLFVSAVSNLIHTVEAIDIATGGRAAGWTPPAAIASAFAFANGQLIVGNSSRVELRNPTTGALVSLLATLNPGAFLRDIEVVGDTAYLGGYFTTVSGVARASVAAVSVTTAAVLPLVLPVHRGWTPDVYALAVRGSTLFVGGESLAAVDLPTGTVLQWAPLYVDHVHDLAVHDDRLYAVGSFAVVNGVQNDLAVFDRAGGRLPYNAGIDNGSLTAVLVSEGSLVVGGTFIHGSADVVSNVAFLPDGPFDGAPKNLRAAVAGNHIDFSWDPPVGGGATAYVIEAGVSPGGTVFTTRVRPPGLGGIAEPRFSVDAPNGTFFVRVRAEVVATVGAPSNEVVVTTPACAPIAPPGGLVGNVTGGVVSLAWQAVPGASACLLEAGSGPGARDVAVLPIGVTTTFSAPAPPGVYHIRVRATTGCATSAPSNEVAIAVPSPSAPGTPINLRAIVNGLSVSLTWDPPADGGPPVAYVLEAGSSHGSADILRTGVGLALSLNASAVPAGTYYVRLRATNAVGTSPPTSDIVLTVRP